MYKIIVILAAAAGMAGFSSCNTVDEGAATAAADSIKVEFMSPTCLWPTQDNYRIDLKPHELDRETGNMEINRFPTLLKTDANSNLGTLVHAIKNEHFCKLSDDAAKILGEPPICSKWVTGVRIWLGTNSNYTKIEPIYEAVALCHEEPNGTTDTFLVKAAATPTYYVHGTAGFSSVTSLAGARLYREHVQLIRAPAGTFEPFNADSDVNSIIYSFQEIGALINDNHDPEVNVWNGISTRTGPSGSVNNFHTLLLGPSSLEPDEKRFLSSFNSKYGNLGSMCPSNCVKVVFQRHIARPD